MQQHRPRVLNELIFRQPVSAQGWGVTVYAVDNDWKPQASKNRNRFRAKCERESRPSASCKPPSSPEKSTARHWRRQGSTPLHPNPFSHITLLLLLQYMSTHVLSHQFPSTCRRPKAGTAGYFIFNTGQVSSCLPKGMKTSHQPEPSRSSWKGSSARVLRLLPWPEQAGSPSPMHLNKHPSLSPLRLLEKPHDYSRDPSMALGPAATAGGPLSTPHLWAPGSPYNCMAVCPSRWRYKPKALLCILRAENTGD